MPVSSSVKATNFDIPSGSRVSKQCRVQTLLQGVCHVLHACHEGLYCAASKAPFKAEDRLQILCADCITNTIMQPKHERLKKHTTVYAQQA